MKILVTYLLILLYPVILSAQHMFTMDMAIEAALENNHSIKISKIDSDMAENRVSRGYAGQLPTLGLTGNLQYSYANLEMVPGTFFQNLINPQNPSAGQFSPVIEFDGVSTTQFHSAAATQVVIFDGLKGRLRYQMFESAGNLADLQYQAEIEQTILTIIESYNRVMLLQKTIDLKQMAMQQSLDRFSAVESRLDFGHASEQQRLQALADLKSDSTEFRSLKLEFENAYRELHRHIGWENRKLIPLEENPDMPHLPEYDDLLTSMKNNNTLLRVRSKRIEQSEIEKSITKAGFLPSLTGSAQYGYQYLQASDGLFESQKQLGFTGGITLRVPIYSGGRNRIDAQIAQANIRREQLVFEESEHRMKTQLDNLWEQMIFLESQLISEKSNLDIYERNYSRAEDAFNGGLITGIELRSAQLSLQQALLRISETDHRLLIAKTRLLYVSGGLLIVHSS